MSELGERADTGSVGMLADLEDVSTIHGEDEVDEDDDDDDDDDEDDDDSDSCADSVDPLMDYDSEETVEVSVDGDNADDAEDGTAGGAPYHLDLYRQAGEQLAAAVLATARASAVAGAIGAMFWKDTGMLPLRVVRSRWRPRGRVLVFMAVATHPGAARILRCATRALGLQPRPLWELTMLEDTHHAKVVYGFLLPKNVCAWAPRAPFLGEHREAELLPSALHAGLSCPAVLGVLLRHLLGRVLPGAVMVAGDAGLQVHMSNVGGFRPSGYAYVYSDCPGHAREALATLRAHLGLRRNAVPVAARWFNLDDRATVRDNVWLPTLLDVDTPRIPTLHPALRERLPGLRLW
jgi:hypothetical protein